MLSSVFRREFVESCGDVGGMGGSSPTWENGRAESSDIGGIVPPLTRSSRTLSAGMGTRTMGVAVGTATGGAGALCRKKSELKSMRGRLASGGLTSSISSRGETLCSSLLSSFLIRRRV